MNSIARFNQRFVVFVQVIISKLSTINSKLKFHTYPHCIGAIDGHDILVVDTEGAVDDTRVDHRRQTAVGGDGGKVVDRYGESQTLHVFRADGYVPAQREVIDVHVVATLQPVVADGLVLDILLLSPFQDVLVGQHQHIHIGEGGAVIDLVTEGTVDLHGDIPMPVTEGDV